MLRHLKRCFFIFKTICLVLFLCNPILARSLEPGIPAKAHSREDASPEMPKNLDEETINAFVAQLPDDQVRRLLLDELKKEATAHRKEEKPQESPFVRIITSAEDMTTLLHRKVADLRTGAKATTGVLPKLFPQLKDPQGRFSTLGVLSAAFILFGTASGTEWFLRRSARELQRRIRSASPSSWTSKLKLQVVDAFVEMGFIAVFTISTLSVYFLFFDESDYREYRRIILFTYLGVILLLRLVGLLARLLFSPQSSQLRLLPLSDSASSYLYRRVIWVFAIAATGLLIHSLLELQRERAETVLFVDAVTGLVVALTVLFLLLENRERISHAIYRSSAEHVRGTVLIRARLAEFWHILAIPYVIVLWCLWLAYLLSNDIGLVFPLFCLLASVPAFLILDAIGQKAIDGILGLESSLHNGAGSKTSSGAQLGSASSHTLQRVIPRMRGFLSLTIAAAIFFFLLQTWGFDVAMGEEASRAAFEIIVVVMIAYVVWRLIEDAINRKLVKIKADHDIEGGPIPDSGGSRIGTLLHLLRTSVIVVLATMIIFISLSAIGVHIGPLLAAAGVVGIAVGFGAQTLVKDIISGILFIVEDAFRMGDFLQIPSAIVQRFRDS